jgi:hypothetical protein
MKNLLNASLFVFRACHDTTLQCKRLKAYAMFISSFISIHDGKVSNPDKQAYFLESGYERSVLVPQFTIQATKNICLFE